MGRLVIFIFLLVSTCSVFAQGTTEEEPEREKKWWEFDLDKERKFIALPSLYFTPETDWAFGAVAVAFFRFSKSDTLSPVSNASFSFSYTLNQQIILRAPFSLYFKNNDYRILGELEFYDFPYFFAGIGNDFPEDYRENYGSLFPRIRVSGLKRVWKNLYTGPTVFIQNTTITSLEEGKLLETNVIPGSQGGVASGIGWELRLDGRNSVFGPTQGHYVRVDFIAHDEAFASDFSYNYFAVDLRKYFNLGKNHVIGLHSYSELNFGTVPFNRLAQLGGKDIMRGYVRGVYRDQMMTAIQMEYRTPIWKFIGFAAFVGTGAVASSFDDFAINNFRPSYGAGIRLPFNKKENINIRIDYGRGDRNSDVFYFTLREAF